MTNQLANELGEVVAALAPWRGLGDSVGYSADADTLIKAAGFIARHHAALAAMVAERDALRPDAERYRWLRENDSADLLAEDVIDDAIDAARQAAGEVGS